MDDTLNEIYDALAAGKPDGVDLSGRQRDLFYVCIERANAGGADDRLGALRVATHLTPDDRVRLVDAMITDPHEKVRRYAFNLAIEARDKGLSALKGAVDGKDEDLAVEALEMLITQGRRTDGLHARQWLESSNPRVRAGAAMLLGNISGPSLAVSLGRLADNDPEPMVREVASLALKRVRGEAEKVQPQNFWEAGPTPIPHPKPAEKPAPLEAAGPPAHAASAKQLDASMQRALESDLDDEPQPSSPAPPPASATPAAPTEQMVPSGVGTEEVRDEPRDWRKPSPLPSQLPGELRALVKLLGMVSPEDRAALVPALESSDANPRNELLRSWRSGGDAALGRGVALAIGLLDLKHLAISLRNFLRDPEPAVRAGAAEGVGMVGAPSLIPPLESLLRDADPDVRLAAVRGMGRLLARFDRYDMIRDKLGPLASNEDEPAEIRAAAQAALNA